MRGRGAVPFPVLSYVYAPATDEGAVLRLIEDMASGGIDALEWEGPRSKEGTAARAWLRTKANSIEGGTSEVMLGIVAKRILDLPGA